MNKRVSVGAARLVAVIAVSSLLAYLAAFLLREPITDLYLSIHQITRDVLLRDLTHLMTVGIILAAVPLLTFALTFISLWTLSGRLHLVRDTLEDTNPRAASSPFLKGYFWTVAGLNVLGISGIYMAGEGGSNAMLQHALLVGVLVASYCLIYKVRLGRPELWKAISALYCVNLAVDLVTGGASLSGSLASAAIWTIVFAILYAGPAALSIKYAFNAPDIWNA